MTNRKVSKKHYRVNDADYLVKLMPYVNIAKTLLNKKEVNLNAAGRLKPKTIDEMLDQIINDNDFI
jgi:hypothetical protein